MLLGRLCIDIVKGKFTCKLLIYVLIFKCDKRRRRIIIIYNNNNIYHTLIKEREGASHSTFPAHEQSDFERFYSAWHNIFSSQLAGANIASSSYYFFNSFAVFSFPSSFWFFCSFSLFFNTFSLSFFLYPRISSK